MSAAEAIRRKKKIVRSLTEKQAVVRRSTSFKFFRRPDDMLQSGDASGVGPAVQRDDAGSFLAQRVHKSVPPPDYENCNSLGRYEGRRVAAATAFGAGTMSHSKSTGGTGGLNKHLSKSAGRLPVPVRSEEVFQALHDALSAAVDCVRSESVDIATRLADLSTSGDGSHMHAHYYDLHKQSKAAERQMKRLEFQLARCDELREQYDTHVNMYRGAESMHQAYERAAAMGTAAGGKNRRKSSPATQTPTANSLKGNMKQLAKSLAAIESELEYFMGHIEIEIKGIAGYSRLAPGDTFEVQVRHGSHKMKTKARVIKDGSQSWDNTKTQCRCLLDEPLYVKASEVRMLGKTRTLSEQQFDTLQLFNPVPRLLTINLNPTGSIKLQMVATWCPADCNGPVIGGTLPPSDQFPDRSESFLSPGGANNDSIASRRGLLMEKNSPASPVLPTKFYQGTATKPINGGYNTIGRLSTSGRTSESSTCTLPRPVTVYCKKDDYEHDGRLRQHQQHAVGQPDGTPAAAAGRSKSQDAAAGGRVRRPHSLEPNLLSVLRSVRPLAQKLLATYPELAALEKQLVRCDAVLKRSVSLGDVLTGRASVGVFDDVAALRTENDSGLGSSRRGTPTSGKTQHSPTGGTGSSVDSSAPDSSAEHSPVGNAAALHATVGSGSSGPSARRFRQRHAAAAAAAHQRRSLAADSAVSPQFVGAATPPMANGAARGFATTGYSELDACLNHHLIRCRALMRALDSCYGILRYKKDLHLYRLGLEAGNLSVMLSLVGRNAAEDVTHVLDHLSADRDVRAVWLSAVHYSNTALLVPADALRREFSAAYQGIVRARYPELVHKVFDTVMLLLTDNGNWNSDIVTVFQFVSALRDRHLPTFVESLGHEAWITSSLRTGQASLVSQVLERLAHVPVVPPTECLRCIGVLLVAGGDANVRAMAERHVRGVRGQLRDDTVATYVLLLEHDDAEARAGAARALGLLRASAAMEQLEFAAQNDHATAVRHAAHRALVAISAGGGSTGANADYTRM